MSPGDRLRTLVLGEPRLFVLICGLGLFMAFVLPAYLYTDHREERLAREGVRASGTVISAERACSGGECQSVEVSYEAAGEEYRLRANTDPSDPRADAGLAVGQSVAVRYDPADPERARLVTLGASEAGFFRFMTFFGLLFFGLPTLWLLVRRLAGRLRAKTETPSR